MLLELGCVRDQDVLVVLHSCVQFDPCAVLLNSWLEGYQQARARHVGGALVGDGRGDEGQPELRDGQGEGGPNHALVGLDGELLGEELDEARTGCAGSAQGDRNREPLPGGHGHELGARRAECADPGLLRGHAAGQGVPRESTENAFLLRPINSENRRFVSSISLSELQ